MSARSLVLLAVAAASVSIYSCGDRATPEPDAAQLDDILAVRTAGGALLDGGVSCNEVHSLLGRYPMDGLTGDVDDASGRGNEGTAYDVGRGVAGVRGNAFSFDPASGSYVDLGAFPGLKPEDQQFAVGVWVYRDRDGVAETVIGRMDGDSASRGWTIGFDADDRVTLKVVSDFSASQYIVLRSETAVPAGVWTHVVVNSLEAGWGRRLWVNGESAGELWVAGVTQSWPTLTTSTASTEPLTVGLGLDGSDDFDGQLDDLVIAQSSGFQPSEVALLVDGTTDANPMACGTCETVCAHSGVCRAGDCVFRSCGPEVTAAWSFDEGIGVIAAEPVNTWHAVGVPDWTPTAHIGAAAAFDDFGAALVESWIEPPGEMAPFTVSAFVYVSTDTTWRRIVGRRDGGSDGPGWELAISESGALALALQSNSGGSPELVEVHTTASVPTGVWTHVAATWSNTGAASGISLFVGGYPASTTTVSDTLDATFVPVYSPISIGGTLNGAGFNGGIDELVLFNVVLSSSEVLTLSGSVTSVCTPTSDLDCATGFASCDGRAWNGCETNLVDDEANCGRCGNVCETGTCDERACTAALIEDCFDGIDNDGDLRVDCDDLDCRSRFGCRGPVENCLDGIDNDGLAGGDLAADCDDPTCASSPACAAGFERNCFDDLNDDAPEDNDVDCADSDCQREGACGSYELLCNDGRDNDGDAATDCADADCLGHPACGSPTTETSCVDGVDNDGDGVADCGDADCDWLGRCTATWELRCDNGVDEDGDGAIDCDDSDCAGRTGCPKAMEEDC